MNKIKVSDARKAIKKNGYGIKNKTFGEVDDTSREITCACVLTHLYDENHPAPVEGLYSPDIDTHRILKWAGKKFGVAYSNGVMDGFDGRKRQTSNNYTYLKTKQQKALYRKGYANGKSLAKSLLPDC